MITLFLLGSMETNRARIEMRRAQAEIERKGFKVICILDFAEEGQDQPVKEKFETIFQTAYNQCASVVLYEPGEDEFAWSLYRKLKKSGFESFNYLTMPKASSAWFQMLRLNIDFALRPFLNPLKQCQQ